MNKNTSEIANTISLNVKKYRIMNNLTQSKLAELLFLDTQYYSQLERGERNFTIEKLVMLCDIFHVGIEKLITVDNEKSSDNSELISSITKHIKKLKLPQLKALEKFITEILPFIN